MEDGSVEAVSASDEGPPSMIKFRLSIVLLCIILPPVLYIATVQFLENRAQNSLYAALKATYLGDTKALLEGTQTLQRAIPQNIERTLAHSRWVTWGGKASVTVRTAENTLLYPASYEELQTGPNLGNSARDIAAENFRMINQGLELALVYKLPHNTWLTNTVLGGYIFIAMACLSLYYRHWSIGYHLENKHRAEELARLTEIEGHHQRQLERLQTDRSQLAADVEKMRAQLSLQQKKSNTSEEAMLEEIITLEQTIAQKETTLEKQLAEIQGLQEKLTQLESPKSKESPRKAKAVDTARKRLTTLYKNVDLHERAIEGYIDLTEDLKIKTEEILSQLNETPAGVTIKRKVFGKKNRLTVLEVVFGYKGRLYFRIKGERQAEVLAIGTKNSQSQDLAFLERL
jgi:hypothetical protein